MSKKIVTATIPDKEDTTGKLEAEVKKAEYLIAALKDLSTAEAGLVLAHIIAAQDTNNVVKSYMAGMPDLNPTAFAAGVENFGQTNETKNVDIRHDGTANIGHLLVEEFGRVVMLDPVTLRPRLVFNAETIPDLLELLGTTLAGQDVVNQSASKTWVYNPNTLPHPTLPSNYRDAINLPNTINVTRSNSTITFVATNVSINANADNITDGATAEANVVLMGGGATYGLGYATVTVNKNNRNGNASVSINRTLKGLPQGVYNVVLQMKADDGINSMGASISQSELGWSFKQEDVRYFQFGLDGMMAFFKDNHIHFTEETGWDVRGKTNIPGVLASGTVSTGGGLTNEWGAKINYGQTITGGYRIFLKEMTHNKYSVQVTPHTNVTFRVSTKTSTYFEILGTGAADFVVFGSNY